MESAVRITAARASNPSGKAGARGFTLVEMTTSIAVLAVILAIAVPSLAGMVRSSKVRAAHAELVSSLMLARSEAAKRALTVSLGASAPSAGGGFSAGWTVWIDANADGVVDGTETVIRRYPDVSSAVVVSAAGNLTLVSFAPTGFLTQAAAANFKLCGRRDAAKGYTVTLQPVGLADIGDEAACP